MTDEEPYWLARGGTEQERLTKQHFVWTKAIGYLLHPSIGSRLLANAKIADVGTGTGIWMTETAKVSPSTYQFDGYDISDAQYPPQDSVPANVTFQLGDFKKPALGLEELRGRYDLLNIRLIIASMGKDVWKETLQNLLSLLKPGGAIQWIEGDFLIARGFRGTQPGSSGGLYLTNGQKKMNGILGKRFGFNFPDFKSILEDTGLQKVEEDVISTDRLPEQRPDFTEIGIGAVFGILKNLSRLNAEGYWTEQEVEDNREKAIEDLKSGAYLRWDLHVSIGFTSAQ